ncbi:Protein of unknown function DUF1677, plant [Cynara cardunculus var. scolymus]|uniref:Uncharacterized protein n=1 Tax=Cynara cardunculus var. scolymus TaxID=59895 RepID=A0A103XZQ2_CYNCS|nr:Protein of unknown function DUF1677, plant [Cynara cardunculus var. scolymus]
MYFQANVCVPYRSFQNPHSLRKAVSDVSNALVKVGKDLEVLTKIYDQVFQAECGCCGQKEDCTKDYIVHVTNDHAGTWVCGLCSEAIKEYLSKNPEKAMQEAVDAHNQICQNFNITTRINPKLTLTWAMKDIAKRSLENRRLRNSSKLNIYRSSSCIPQINPNTK